MEDMIEKRVLVLSNNCFSLSNSNGRTLGNLFYGWPKENLAQFCVIAKDPNWDICNNYYCLEDKSVLKSFLCFKKAVGRKLNPNVTNVPTDTKNIKLSKKTLGKVLLREFVWCGKRWNSCDFLEWVTDFNPDVLVLQFGDSVFMLNMAYHISQELNIPIVIYNTEGYYFFTRNWYHSAWYDSFLFKIYRKIYRNAVKKLMSLVAHSVFLNDKLKEDYDKEFNVSSSVIYNSSSISQVQIRDMNLPTPRVSYLGNLDLYRDEAIIEVAEVLQEINPSLQIDVYGKANNLMIKHFQETPGVAYHGFVTYDDVVKIIDQSDIIFHVETERGNQEWQLQYAFTTKIADSVSSGRCFVVYAPRDLACSQYVDLHKCGCVASNKEELKSVLESIIYNKSERDMIIRNSLTIAKQNHNLFANAKLFQSIIVSV